MRSVVYLKNGKLDLIDVPEPQIKKPDDVKVKIAYAGVCGSDLHVYRQEFEALFPDDVGTGVPQGHEASGTIVELGPEATVKGLKIGDKVTYYYNTHCGKCYYCRSGLEQFCENIVATNGAMSDYIVVSEQSVHKLEDCNTLKQGALVEPITVALHGVDMCGIKPGNTVCISGGGTMGMLMIQLCHKYGATKVTVIEPIEMKRRKALELGADYVIDPVNQDRVEEAMKITNGRGFDFVIEASGSWRACDGIEKLAGRGGVVEFYAAMYKPDYSYSFNLFQAFLQELRIVGGVMQSPYMFPRSIQLLKDIDIDSLLVEGTVFEPENFRDAFQAQMDGRTIKSLIKFDPDVD